MIIIGLACLVGGGARATETPPAGPSSSVSAGPPVPGALASLPKVLGDADVALYEEIFALQEQGRWREADRRIGKLKDRVLMGHVEAQRYLHPTRYRSHYRELAKWLARYADHPEARRIYALALKRKPKRARAPRPPRSPFPTTAGNGSRSGAGNGAGNRRAQLAGPAERRLQRLIGSSLRRGRLGPAETYLARADVSRRYGSRAVDRTRAVVAAGWFRHGDFERALRLASAAARRSGAAAPRTRWWAGLAAFRLGRHIEAAGHFEALSKFRDLSDRDRAAALFWAARANLVGGRAARVSGQLAKAARFERNFYGQIAARIYQGGAFYDWTMPHMGSAEIIGFAATGPGRRTLALVQVGEEDRAAAEFRNLHHRVAPQTLRAVITLADAADMPGAALRAGRLLLRTTGERIDSGLYPIPHWVPQGGYSIDRALVYALARQESGFNTRAKSPSGARGLLQLMPATARFMAASGRKFRGRNRARLFDPELNLTLGQKYVDHLLTEEVVAGNLVLMIAAYNGGPGNLAKWQAKLAHDSDPLLFIEAIPLRETRLFVKRVFENLWAYRARLGQPATSLDALASGRWPLYVGLDGTGLGVAEGRR